MVRRNAKTDIHISVDQPISWLNKSWYRFIKSLHHHFEILSDLPIKTKIIQSNIGQNFGHHLAIINSKNTSKFDLSKSTNKIVDKGEKKWTLRNRWHEHRRKKWYQTNFDTKWRTMLINEIQKCKNRLKSHRNKEITVMKTLLMQTNHQNK